MKITVSSKEFQTFVHALNLIDSEGSSIVVYRDHIDTLLVPLDNMLILYARINILNPDETGLEEGESKRLNIRDLSKFQRLLDNNNQDTFTFSVNKNYITYQGPFIKNAKFVLNENPPKTISKRITVEWFNKFEKKFSCFVKKDIFKKLIQLGSFTGLQDTKVYLSTQNSEFIADLNDKTRNNIDSISLKLSDEFEGTVSEAIIPLIALTKLSLGTDNILIEASEIRKGANVNEAIFITISFDNVLLKYMLNCKKS